MKEIKKCTLTPDGKFVSPCEALSEVTEFGNPYGKKKGIFNWEYHSRESGPTRSFFGVKSGEWLEKGMAFNYCPFCGTAIDSPFLQMVNSTVSIIPSTTPENEIGQPLKAEITN